jgi:hypothetical protein
MCFNYTKALIRELNTELHNYLNSNPSVLSHTENRRENPIACTCTHPVHYFMDSAFFFLSSTVNYFTTFTGNSF